jgi:hypothetical protein
MAGDAANNDNHPLISLGAVCFDSTASEFFRDETTILHRSCVVSVEKRLKSIDEDDLLRINDRRNSAYTEPIDSITTDFPCSGDSVGPIMNASHLQSGGCQPVTIVLL